MRDLKFNVRIIISILFFEIFFFNLQAATLKGHILDSKSKEALSGAVIFNKSDNQQNGIAGLDGSFSIKNIRPGTYTFDVQFVGYNVLEKTIIVKDSNQIITEDFLMNQESYNLGQVQVVSSYEKGSDSYARTEEKKSDDVMNVISSKTIQLLPDLTIGDVLQRVSGVTTEKSVTGGGRYATIRGMDKRYNYTTVDGVKIPSPDYKNRYVPMDIFPAEIVERLEVIKSLTPDMEGDAIGGAMNLVLKDAPEHFLFDASLATGYDQALFGDNYEKFDAGVINPKSPNEINGADYGSKVSDFPLGNITFNKTSVAPNLFGGFTIGNRLLGGRLGLLASVSYQNVYSYSDGLFIKPQAQPLPGPNFNTPEWDYIQSRTNSVQQSRGAGHIKADYIFNKRNKINFYTVYAAMTQLRARITQDTDNTLPGSELNPHYESIVTYQHILNSTLKGTDSITSHLLFDWTFAYSRAWADTPDWDELSLTGTVGSPTNIFSSLSRIWMNNTDEDFSGYANLTYNFKLFGQDIELKAGAMNRDKSRNAFYGEYDFIATPGQVPFTTINAILSNPEYFSFRDTTGSPQNSNTYSIQEDITAYYGMGKIMLGNKIELVGGMRIENTSQAYQTAEPDVVPGKNGAKQYTDYLPSAEIKYKINKKQAIHASYFASISRPNFFELVPYQFAGDYYTEVGNPYLYHTVANNYDLRYEFFPKPSEQILAGVFYKQIYDPIELAVERGSGPSSTIVKPENIGGDTLANPCINYGFEFVFTKYFNHFGVSANYTYTHSRITVPVLEYGNSVGNSQPLYSETTETRPLQGQVDNLANLSLIYKLPKVGFEAQLSAVYTGKSISDVSLYYGLDLWQMPMTKIDFSFEKRISKKINLTLYGKAMNLLNTPLVVRMFPPADYKNTPGTSSFLPDQDVSSGNLSSIVVEKEYYGQSYLLGVRYKF